MRTRTKQPFGLAPLRRTSSAATGLLSCIYSTQRGIPVSLMRPIQGDTSLYAVEPTTIVRNGHRFTVPSASSTSYGWGAYIAKSMSTNIGAMTLATLGRFNSGFTTGSIVTNAPGGGFGCLQIAHRFGAGTNELGFSMRAGSGTYYEGGTGITDAVPARFCVARLKADGPIELWVDGVMKWSTTHARGGFNTFYTNPQWHTTYVQRDGHVAVSYVWDRYITNDEILELTADPFCLLGAEDPLENVGIVVTAAQYARPATDGTNTGWTPSTGATIEGVIDEVTADHADYAYTRDPDAMFDVTLSSVTDPAVGTGHVVRFTAYSPYAQRVRVALYDGTTLVAEWTDTLTTGTALYEHTLTEAQANSITGGSYAGSLHLRGYGVRP